MLEQALCQKEQMYDKCITFTMDRTALYDVRLFRMCGFIDKPRRKKRLRAREVNLWQYYE